MIHSLAATVNAPPERVWSLIVDVEAWPSMTASMTEVRRLDGGPLRVGSEATIKQPRLPVARWRVTDLQDGRSFTWESASAGVTTSGGHVVEPDGRGSTIVTLTLEQRGPLAGIVGALFGDLAKKYLAMELEGFRSGAEAVPAEAARPA